MDTLPSAATQFSYTDLLSADHLRDALREDVRRGLSGQNKSLPPVWFYDQTGSELFEKICTLPEYYPTRTEDAILAHRAARIATITRARSIVELGSGDSVKTRRLIDALSPALRTVVNLDVSESALRQAAHALAERYPALQVRAVRADYTMPMDLRTVQHPRRRLYLFLGSTIGNCTPEARASLLSRLQRGMRPGDWLLLGVDLVKDPRVLERAYNDSKGVTAAFNLNLLHRLNRELGADFDPAAFAHRACWNAQEERIEMRLRSLRAQQVTIPGAGIVARFEDGEEILTEISTKLRAETVRAELEGAELRPVRWWTDEQAYFGVSLSTVNRPASGRFATRSTGPSPTRRPPGT